MPKQYASGFQIKWMITHFSIAMQKTEIMFRSPPIVVDVLGGVKWYLSLHLRDIEVAEYIGVYLTRDDDLVGIQVPIKFTIELQTADMSLRERRESLESVFERNTTWGFDRCIKRSFLLEHMNSTLLPDNNLLIYCKIERAGFTDYIPETIMNTNKLEFIWSIRPWSKFSYLCDVYSKVNFIRECKTSFCVFICTKDVSDQNMILKVTEEGPKRNFLICRMSILDTKGCEVLLRETRHQFSKESDTTFANLFPEEKIYNSYLKDDTLTLRCNLSVAATNIHQTKHASPDDQSKEEKVIQECFEHMYKHSILCDVKARAGSKIVICHKYVLCKRSLVLKNKLTRSEQISEGYVVIDFDDLDGNTLQQMIDFIYSDELSDLDYASSMKLFTAGHKYQIKCLEEKCSSYLRTFFSFQNIFDILIAAQKHKDRDLKRCAIIYINTYFSRICLTAEWEQFRTTKKKMAVKIYKLIQRSKGI
ncbi:uncharacterized protein LOC129987836 [Argiope bruennichi]|uniref:Protein maternal effect lethal 26 like protein n=1 Tax=Argiope bruennichi TaxID=94029 RepID=A0A8T0EGI8_ARGBR|nr:uncharacterized protein LOC129987836 [Argiope bruennichi]KAF8771723.1 Protein maternal effect lethal 26 like protein [Argiope bruennichi]